MEGIMLKRIMVFIVSLIIVVTTSGTLIAQQPGGDKASRGERPPREDKGPKAGAVAPVFKLMSLDGKESFDLESFKGKKPVVLFFGSYT
jgi:hypothetical protein